MILTAEERKVLEVISQRHLISRSELTTVINKEINGSTLSVVNNLIDRGLVSKLTGITMENSFVITKEGMQVLKQS